MGSIFSLAGIQYHWNELLPLGDWFERRRLLPLRKVLEHIGITGKQCRLLHSIFLRVDKESNIAISLGAFFSYFKFQYITPMGKRFFLLFDTDRNGELDFTEFVMCTWNYLTLDDICLIDLAFQMYDIDGTGSLDSFDVSKILMEGYGSEKRMSQPIFDLYSQFTERHGKYYRQNFDCYQFRKLVLANMVLFWPLFVLHKEMSRRIIGAKFWQKHAKKRRKALGKQMLTLDRFVGELQWVLTGKKAENFHMGTRKRVVKSKGKFFKKSEADKFRMTRAERLSLYGAQIEAEGVSPHSRLRATTFSANGRCKVVPVDLTKSGTSSRKLKVSTQKRKIRNRRRGSTKF